MPAVSAKGKGRATDADFEAAFARAAAMQSARIDEVDKTTELAETLEATTLDEEQGERDYMTNFQKYAKPSDLLGF